MNTLRIGEQTPFGTYQGGGNFAPNPYTPWTSKTGFDCAGLHSEGYEPADMNCPVSPITPVTPVAPITPAASVTGETGIKPSDWILLAVAVILAIVLLRR